MKIRLIYKFLLIFLLFSVGLACAMGYVTGKDYEKTITEKYYEQAINIAQLSASVLDGDKIVAYATTFQTDAAYEEKLKELNNIKVQTDVYYLYVMYPISEEQGIYIFDTALTKEQILEIGEEDPAELGYQVDFITEEGVDNFITAKEVLQTGKPSEEMEITKTLQGSTMQTLGSVYAPVKDSNDRPVAFVGVDVRMEDVDTTTKNAVMSLIQMIVILAIVFFALLVIVAEISIIRPIKELKKYAERISDGIFGEKMRVRGHDEITEISEVFNRMSNSISGHMEEVNIINRAYHKYVPSEIFDIMKKDKVTDMKLGDQVMTNLAIMSFDIIGFNEITKRMDSEEMFAFINRILNPIVPLVGEKGGVIEQFKNCGFIVFQKESCEKLLESAILVSKKFQKIIKEEESERNRNSDFGMAIAYGEVMLGTVGNEERMATISVSEQNNICGYLSNNASKYYSHILMTATAVAKIPDFEMKYSARCVGYIYITAINQTEKLYDVYDGDSDEVRRLKDQTKDIFEQGINYFCTRDFDRARICFVSVLKVFNRDNAAREYLYRCNQLYGKTETEDQDIYAEIY